MSVMRVPFFFGQSMGWRMCDFGSFNEVHTVHERFGSSFSFQGARAFNNFISSSSLFDLPLDDKHLSDHRPILMRELNVDYGATPFRVFHSWFNMEGFDKVVENSWKISNFVESNSMVYLKNKLQILKQDIKTWSKEARKSSLDAKQSIQKKLSDVDKVLDQGGYSEDTGIIIPDGEWLVDPSKVKHEFLNRFACRFSKPKDFYISLDTQFPNGLSGYQLDDLERPISYDEIKRAEVDRTTRIVGCSTFSSPFHYLGVKVGGVMSKISSWDEVNSKMYSRLSKWKLNSLSIGGRLTLLKSMVQMVWISWKKVLTSKQKGGLSLSILFAINRALMFKWLWSFKTQSPSLWSRVIKAIYGVHGALDTFFRISRSSPWLDILREVSSLKFKGIDLCALIRKKVGNEEDTFFWEEHWKWEKDLRSQFLRLYALKTCKHITVAAKLRHDSLASSFRRPPRGVAEETQFGLFNSCLADLIIPQMLNRWFWSLEGLGEFTVKSTRILINDSFHSNGDVPARWVKLVLIKINIFAWRVFLVKLPTRLNLSLRGVEIPSILCPICNVAPESSSHLFFTCPLARLLRCKRERELELEEAATPFDSDPLLPHILQFVDSQTPLPLPAPFGEINDEEEGSIAL
ncbi:RNA-directed DNA polymerase, eukaryota, reverse transcriptase zinc-binding domain protein [Tanacetum coccineum]